MDNSQFRVIFFPFVVRVSLNHRRYVENGMLCLSLLLVVQMVLGHRLVLVVAFVVGRGCMLRVVGGVLIRDVGILGVM